MLCLGLYGLVCFTSSPVARSVLWVGYISLPFAVEVISMILGPHISIAVSFLHGTGYRL